MTIMIYRRTSDTEKGKRFISLPVVPTQTGYTFVLYQWANSWDNLEIKSSAKPAANNMQPAIPFIRFVLCSLFLFITCLSILSFLRDMSCQYSNIPAKNRKAADTISQYVPVLSSPISYTIPSVAPAPAFPLSSPRESSRSGQRQMSGPERL